MNGIGLDCGTATVKLAMLHRRGSFCGSNPPRIMVPQFKQFGHFSANYCRRIAMLAAIQ